MAIRVQNPYTYAFNLYYLESLIIQARMRTLSSKVSQSMSILKSSKALNPDSFSLEIQKFKTLQKTMAEYTQIMKKNKADYCPAKHIVKLTEKDRETRELCTRWEKLESSLQKDIQNLNKQFIFNIHFPPASEDPEEVGCIMH